MEFEEYKKKIITHLQDSNKLFSNKGKKERELWVAKKFLGVLGQLHTENELTYSETPDIIFRDSRLEIIERMDEGRERHKEYKDKQYKFEKAQTYSEVLSRETWDQEMISLQELLNDVEKFVIEKKGHYSLDAKVGLDLLIYVNLQKFYIADEDFVFALAENSSLRQWQSVSLVFNSDIVCVVFASKSAPAFIRAVADTIIKKAQL